MITCPKCGFEQPESAECRRCGVIFSRVPKQQPSRPAAPLRAGRTSEKGGGFYRAIRITVLLLIFLGLAFNVWITRARVADWKSPLWVVIHPICGDGNPETVQYVDSLTPGAFEPVADFFSGEAGRYELPLEQPFRFFLAPRLASMPPQRPAEPTALNMILWSLHLRFWAWRNSASDVPVQDIHLFIVYYDRRRTLVENSFVMEKGYIGVVHAYAAIKMEDKNSIVIAHELLHLAGATDKYAPATEQPIYPGGYADPDADPLYPQHKAEIMAGSIPVSKKQSAMPESLAETLIGPATAREINWVPAG